MEVLSHEKVNPFHLAAGKLEGGRRVGTGSFQTKTLLPQLGE